MGLLDIRTLLLLAFLIDTFLTLMLYVFWKNEKTYPGFRTYMLSLLVMAGACFLYALPEMVPNAIGLPVANLLITLSIIMRFDSFWKLLLVKPLPRILYISCLLGIPLFFVLIYYVSILDLFRIPVLALFILFILIIGCVPLAAKGDPETYRIRRAVFGVILVWAILFIVRLLVGQVNPDVQHFFYDSHPLNTVYLAFSIIADILITGFFLLLNMSKARSELRSSEQRYRNLCENLPDYIVVHDAGHIYYTNQPMLQLAGLSLQEIRERSLGSFMTPASAETVRQITASDSGSIQCGPLDVDLVQRDGTIRHGIMRTIPMSGDDLPGFLSVITDVTELKMAENSLARATTKLNLFTHLTLNDIHNAVFYLSGYIELGKQVSKDEKMHQVIDRQMELVQTISKLLLFAREYQGLGLKPPLWQNVMHAYLLGVSHTAPLEVTRTLKVDGLEIFADPLLENVFSALSENVAVHSRTATAISLRYDETPEGLTLIFEDNGIGIPASEKEKIFERKAMDKKGLGLFLVREILGITEITIRETGVPGRSARFEIRVTKGSYRFSKSP